MPILEKDFHTTSCCVHLDSNVAVRDEPLYIQVKSSSLVMWVERLGGRLKTGIDITRKIRYRVQRQNSLVEHNRAFRLCVLQE